MISYGKHRFPGKLFVVEGTDGSGKSTQLALLHQWLKVEGYPVFFSEWNSSPLVKDTTRRAKKRRLFTPTTFSLLHATDFADRTERDIIPPLKAGAIVLADRYIYTAFARDVARAPSVSTRDASTATVSRPTSSRRASSSASRRAAPTKSRAGASRMRMSKGEGGRGKGKG